MRGQCQSGGSMLEWKVVCEGPVSGSVGVEGGV